MHYHKYELLSLFKIKHPHRAMPSRTTKFKPAPSLTQNATKRESPRPSDAMTAPAGTPRSDYPPTPFCLLNIYILYPVSYLLLPLKEPRDATPASTLPPIERPWRSPTALSHPKPSNSVRETAATLRAFQITWLHFCNKAQWKFPKSKTLRTDKKLNKWVSKSSQPFRQSHDAWGH